MYNAARGIGLPIDIGNEDHNSPSLSFLFVLIIPELSMN
jgi:hypothetical protein